MTCKLDSTCRTTTVLLQATGKATTSAGDATPLDVDKTLTVCLFERFERLTLGGATPSTAPGTAAAATSGRAPAAPAAAHDTSDSAGSTSTAASSGGSEQFVGRVRPARRSVAFGTPSVPSYTPAGPSTAAVEGDGDNTDKTPLWSNAGEGRGWKLFL